MIWFPSPKYNYYFFWKPEDIRKHGYYKAGEVGHAPHSWRNLVFEREGLRVNK